MLVTGNVAARLLVYHFVLENQKDILRKGTKKITIVRVDNKNGSLVHFGSLSDAQTPP